MAPGERHGGHPTLVPQVGGAGMAVDVTRLSAIIVATVLLGALCVACGPSDPSPLNVLTESDLEYLMDASEQLDVLYPEEPGPWPLVIVAHGGYQTRGDYAPLAEAIASEGAVVFNVDWLDRFPFASGINQLGCAIRFARAVAADFGGNPDRVVIFGHSRGAFAAIGVSLTGGLSSAGCSVASGSSLPDGFVGYEGPYDMVEQYYEGTGMDYRPMQQEDPDLWHALNPYSGLGQNPDLALRLIHGGDEADDNSFPSLGLSTEFHRALTSAGYDSDLTVVDGALHGSVWRVGEEAFITAVRAVMDLAGE